MVTRSVTIALHRDSTASAAAAASVTHADQLDVRYIAYYVYTWETLNLKYVCTDVGGTDIYMKTVTI